ncbi:hypothetical protein OG394_15585 [Kribbella sp. NBC_01245]|uniref:hypothetical protein n=1 Tax=Kribbella sp. NBC_01245 TaxID=2903578 RepID=UPI002E2B4816|nr:hypothetical protein [Kribbella sp. NBC_01245]
MSSSTMPSEATSASSNAVATAFAVGSVLAALGSVGYISLNDDSPREAFSNPVSTAAGVAATVGAVVLALALARWRTTLPVWAQTSAAAGLVMVATNSWFSGTGIRAISDHTDDQLFERLIFEAPWIMVMSLPKMVLCLVAFIALAVAGWRKRSLPRSSSVLLVLAGVVSVWPPYPPGLLLASAALFIASRSVARSLRHPASQPGHSAP